MRTLPAISILVLGLAATAQAAEPPALEPARLEATLRAAMDKAHTPGLAVAVFDANGVLWSAGLGTRNAQGEPVLTSTPFPLGSVSKTAVGVVAMRLVEQGKLSLEDPLEKWAPELAIENPWRASHPIRVVDLLEHTSGLPDMVKCEAELPSGTTQPGLAEALRINPCVRSVRWAPGDRFAYSNVGYTVAALALEHAGGAPFHDLVQREVFAPLGLARSSFHAEAARAADVARGRRKAKWPEAPAIALFPAGGWVAPVEEVAAVGSMLLGRGVHAGKPVLGEASVARMEETGTGGHARELFRGYGIGLERDDARGQRLVFHDGAIAAFQSRLAYSREAGRGYVLLVNDVDADLDVLSAALEPLALGAQPSTARSAPAEDLRPYEGTYQLISPRSTLLGALEILSAVRRVRADGDALVVTTGSKEKRLVPLGGGLFRKADGSVATVQFAPRDGQLRMVDGGTWVRRDVLPLRLLIPLVPVCAALVLLGLLVLPVALVVLFLKRKKLERTELRARAGLVALFLGSSVALAWFVAVMFTGLGFGPGEDERATLPARLLQALSILFPLLSAAAAVALVRARRVGLLRFFLWPMSAAGLYTAAFAAWAGWVGVAIWCTAM